MTVKFDVSTQEAIQFIAAIQEAAQLEQYSLKVLGMGGDKPLVFATHYIDKIPYQFRAMEGRWPEEAGRGAERFTADTWHVCDLDVAHFPYDDKEFDIVWCYDVVEQRADPLSLLRELSRIAKCGYIRCIHRNFGSSYNVESEAYTGYHKHLWLVEPDKKGLKFIEHLLAVDEEVAEQITPEYTGEREIGVWWTGTIAGTKIRSDKSAWQSDMKRYADMTRKIRYAT